MKRVSHCTLKQNRIVLSNYKMNHYPVRISSSDEKSTSKNTTAIKTIDLITYLVFSKERCKRRCHVSMFKSCFNTETKPSIYSFCKRTNQLRDLLSIVCTTMKCLAYASVNNPAVMRENESQRSRRRKRTVVYVYTSRLSNTQLSIINATK